MDEINLPSGQRRLGQHHEFSLLWFRLSCSGSGCWGWWRRHFKWRLQYFSVPPQFLQDSSGLCRVLPSIHYKYKIILLHWVLKEGGDWWRREREGGEWCSTLPSPGYSMWNPWNGGWMDSIVLVDGFHGMVDGFHTFPDGFHTFFRWIPWSFQVDSIWTEFMELWFYTHPIPISRWSPYGLHME